MPGRGRARHAGVLERSVRGLRPRAAHVDASQQRLRRFLGLRRRERLQPVCAGRLRRHRRVGQALPLRRGERNVHVHGHDDGEPILLDPLGASSGQVRAHEAHGPQPCCHVPVQPRPVPVDARERRLPRRRRGGRARSRQGSTRLPRRVHRCGTRRLGRLVHRGRRAGSHPEHRRRRDSDGARDLQPRTLHDLRRARVRVRPQHGGSPRGRGRRVPRLQRLRRILHV